MDQPIHDAPGAAQSQGRQRLPYNLMTVDQIMEHVKYRAEHRDNMDVDAAALLAMHYREPDQQSPTGGYFATVPVRNADGSVVNKTLPLSETAVKTACRLMDQSLKPSFWAKADDPDAFPKMFTNMMDSHRNNRRGLLLRHDGLKVNAILPRNYIIRDAAQLLADFIPALQENVGEVVGVMGIESGDGDVGSYRVVMGNNIIPGLAPEDGQYLMFNLNTSETGLMNTKTSLGVYRTFCSNSAIRVQTLSRWDHRNPFEPFFDQTARVIRESGYLQDSYGKIFAELLASPLPLPASDLLHAFKREKVVSGEHVDASLLHVRSEPAETQYDLFNIMTRAAQDLPTIVSRENAEATTMRIFTETGGILEALRRAESRPRRRKGGLVDLEGNGNS